MAQSGGEDGYQRVHFSVARAKVVWNDLMQAELYVEETDRETGSAPRGADRAMSVALRAAREFPAVRVGAGGYQVRPDCAPGDKGRPGEQTGWRTRTSLVLESEDTAAMGELLARLQPTLGTASIRFAVAPRTREDAENAAIRDAMHAFRARAKLIAEEWGAGNYRLVKMDVRAGAEDETAPPEEAPPPTVDVRAGTTRIAAIVSGVVELYGEPYEPRPE